MDETRREVALSRGNIGHAVARIDVANQMLVHTGATIGQANSKSDSANGILGRTSITPEERGVIVRNAAEFGPGVGPVSG
jgi:hypothetical protein